MNGRSRNPRALRGTPPEFQIVSESFTLNLKSIPNPAQSKISYNQKVETLRRKNQNQAAWSRKIYSCSSPRNSGSLYTIFARKIIQICQAFTMAQSALDHKKLHNSQLQICRNRSRSSGRQGRSLRIRGSKCRASSPRVSKNVIAYGMMAQKTDFDLSMPYSIPQTPIPFTKDILTSFVVRDPSLYFSEYEQPDLCFCYEVEQKYIKSYQAQTLNSQLISKFRVTPRRMKTTMGNVVWDAYLRKEDMAVGIQDTPQELWQRHLDNRKHSLVDLDDSDNISVFDDASSVESLAIKRRRSNSVPESSHEWKRFAPYTSVLDRMGAQWIGQLQTRQISERDIKEDWLESMDDCDDTLDVNDEGRFPGFQTQQQKMASRQSRNQSSSSLLLENSSRSSSPLENTDDGVSTIRSDQDALFGSVSSDDTFELPIPSSAVSNVFLTTKRGISHHLHDVISRLRQSAAGQREEQSRIGHANRPTLTRGKAVVPVATVAPEPSHETTTQLQEMNESAIFTIEMQHGFQYSDESCSVEGQADAESTCSDPSTTSEHLVSPGQELSSYSSQESFQYRINW